MDLIGTICELAIPGRWGRAERSDMIVRDSFRAANGRSYLLVENRASLNSYLLTNRYDGEEITSLEPKKMFMVVIGKKKEDVLLNSFSPSSQVDDYFDYFGTGIIQIVDADFEAARKDRNTDTGIMGQLRGIISRLSGKDRG